MRFFIICLLCLSLHAEKIIFPSLTTDVFKDDKFLKLVFKVINYQLKQQSSIDIEMVALQDEKLLQEKYASGEYLFVNISPMQYFKYQTFYDRYTSKYVIPKINNINYIEYLLIANYKELKTLTKKPDFSQYSLYLLDSLPTSRIWMSNLLEKEYKLDLEDSFKNIRYSSKPNTIASKTFFEERNLAIIDRASYNTLIELNPQYKKQLAILHRSKPIFFNMMTAVHKSVSKEQIQIMVKLQEQIEIFFEESNLSFGGKLNGMSELSKERLLLLKEQILSYDRRKSL